MSLKKESFSSIWLLIKIYKLKFQCEKCNFIIISNNLYYSVNYNNKNWKSLDVQINKLKFTLSTTLKKLNVHKSFLMFFGINFPNTENYSI